MASSEAVLALLRAYRPRFESKPDSVAFAVHATFLASGFRCLAVGPDAAEIAAGSKGSDSSADAGIEGWNATPDVYTFAYAHQTPGDSAEGASADKTAGTVVVQCLSVAEGELLMVDATGMGGTGSEAAGGASAFVSHLEIRVPEYTSADTPPTSADYSKIYTRLSALVSSILSSIIKPFTSTTTSDASGGAGTAAARAGAGASAAQTSSTGTAGEGEGRGAEREGGRTGGVYFEEPERGSVGEGGGVGGIVYPPMPAGPPYDDLHPGGGAGIMPTRPGFGGGSMLVGPHDPRWGPQFPGGVGGVGPLPPGMPPGARFDPFGPPGIPGFEPGRFGDGGPRPRGPPGGGIHPDMQHFPGAGDDYM
ncbi:hypothetical protein CLOM_g22598 [Closterium sp. NIES-68]|nr:hypothetical protein CLOM_g22598 [Closterium sp. NIES-68]GJP84385.1 hypothetical protein CLOP_g14443 [Closterium sp. NIES-67]